MEVYGIPVAGGRVGWRGSTSTFRSQTAGNLSLGPVKSTKVLGCISLHYLGKVLDYLGTASEPLL